MIESSIDISIPNLWQCWIQCQKGKKAGAEILWFKQNIEAELFKLNIDLKSGKYRHGVYRNFRLCDNKPRVISVPLIRDRIVHRLLYNYLVEVFNKSFIHDAWSCRSSKGLHGAIERAKYFRRKFKNCFILKLDIKKFFNSVDHDILKNLLVKRIRDARAEYLLFEVIKSFCRDLGKGIPIGNLTSQIFANIYLNEMDRHIKHVIRPLAYLRYGDDCILFIRYERQSIEIFRDIKKFLAEFLKLGINFNSSQIIKPGQALNFIGCIFYPNGIKLNSRNKLKIIRGLNFGNLPSYRGLAKAIQPKMINQINHQVLKLFE